MLNNDLVIHYSRLTLICFFDKEESQHLRLLKSRQQSFSKKAACRYQGRTQDFTKEGAGAEPPKFFFRTQVRNCFAPTPLFTFLLYWTNFNFFFASGCKTASHPPPFLHSSFFGPTSKTFFRTRVRNCFAPILFCTHSREVNCFCWHF